MVSGSAACYDADGMRYSRYNGSTSYSYRYVDGKLTQMNYIGTRMRFTYGADGRPMSITYDGTDAHNTGLTITSVATGGRNQTRE